MERTVRYFDKPGKDNTAGCLEIVKEAVRRDGYKHVIVASTTGETGLLFSEALKGSGATLVVITHSHGFKEQNSSEMPQEARLKIESNGAKVYTGSMLTHSLDVAFASKFSGVFPTQIIAQSLRRFGEGAKVAIECVMMACDAGLAPEGVDVLSVAGTAHGSDSVVAIKSAASKRFLELRVQEILAKPKY